MKDKNLETLGTVTHTHTHGQPYKKREKGITLIALIVTIIVLLILAGVTIGTLTGDNGLIARSKEAKNEAIGMQENTSQDRDALYGEIIGNKTNYEQSGEVDVDLELEKKSDTSIKAIANASGTKSEIISYTFYIKKITENDSAYVIIKKSDKLTNEATQSDLEKDMGYRVKVVAIDKEGVTKTAERNIVLGDAIKISVTPISGPDSYPSTVLVTATSVAANMDYIKLPNGEKVEAKNGSFKLKTTFNSTKNGPIIFTAYDEEGNAGLLEYMEQNVVNFETEWTIAEDNTEVIIPIAGNVDVYIDYGDGTKENIKRSNIPWEGENNGQRHTFEKNGKYIVKISGECTRFGNGNYYDYDKYKQYNEMYTTNITGIKKWGCLNNDYYGFGRCTHIEGTIPKAHPNSFKNITNFTHTFYKCSGITGSIPEGLFKNCLKTTKFISTFEGCSGLIGEIPGDLFLNTPNIESMYGTFGRLFKYY